MSSEAGQLGIEHAGQGCARSVGDLATRHFTIKSLRDTVRSGMSYVVILDSLQQNTIRNRSVIFNLYHEDKETTINNTVTQHDGRQLYLVTGIGATFTNVVQSFGGRLGLAYKDRADRIYTATYGMNTLGQHSLEFSKSWKISFRRKP